MNETNNQETPPLYSQRAEACWQTASNPPANGILEEQYIVPQFAVQEDEEKTKFPDFLKPCAVSIPDSSNISIRANNRTSELSQSQAGLQQNLTPGQMPSSTQPVFNPQLQLQSEANQLEIGKHLEKRIIDLNLAVAKEEIQEGHEIRREARQEARRTERELRSFDIVNESGANILCFIVKEDERVVSTQRRICDARKLTILKLQGMHDEPAILQLNWQTETGEEHQVYTLEESFTAKKLKKLLTRDGVRFFIPRRIENSVLENFFAILCKKIPTKIIPSFVGWNETSEGELLFAKNDSTVYTEVKRYVK